MIKKILYFMLVFSVAAVVAELLHAPKTLVFILAGIGLIPLADLIGEATEELTTYTGPQIGGLLNATLGNAAELIITIFALKEGLVELVIASITGSILGNVLLVLGLSILLGGIKNGVQTFDRRRAAMNGTMVVLAVMALVIPSFFHTAIGEDPRSELLFSEGIAVIMIVLYGLHILYGFMSQKGPMVREAVEHEAKWSLRKSLLVLIGATVGVAVVSEVLVGAVEPVTEALGLTEFFLGIVIIPLVGNVAEHLVAVEVALKDDMELSLAISLGSSLQIALFVAPLLVFISLFFEQPLLLIFTPYELIALFSASLVAALIALDGESTWLEGAQLLAVYLIVTLAFFFLPA